MPWTAASAAKHDKAAKTPKLRRKWAHIANSVLKATGSDVKAIKAANSKT